MKAVSISAGLLGSVCCSSGTNSGLGFPAGNWICTKQGVPLICRTLCTVPNAYCSNCNKPQSCWILYFCVLKSSPIRLPRKKQLPHLKTILAALVLRLFSLLFFPLPSCCTTPDVELTLLAFALARGSVAKMISSLCTITDHLDTPYKASSLIASMATVRQNLLYKYGKWMLDFFLLYVLMIMYSFLSCSTCYLAGIWNYVSCPS